MVKRIQGIADGVVSFAKVLPLIGGGLVGLFGHAPGSQSPMEAAKTGDYTEIVESLACNYTWYSPGYGNFKSDRGIGTKALLAGIIVHKVIGWVAE